MKQFYTVLFFFPLFFNLIAQNAVITGELKQYHKTTLTWSAEDLTETQDTYKNYRLNVVFTSPSGETYNVPGYYAADGNAAETSATSGDKWRCHFNPLEIGEWTYSVSYRAGSNIAATLDVNAGTPITPLDGDTGTFTITETDKTGKDLRGKGKLEYVGEHFLRWTNGEYFLKIGSNSPDNFLEYNEFDNTTRHLRGDRFYPDHIADWQPGDPTWKNDLGRGLIGVVNYLGTQDINAQYILTDSSYGDTDSVFPWNSRDEHFNYDCSKLDQWQIIFDHLIEKGLMVHLVLSEAEQQSLFELASDASGDASFADARKIYFREMVARFGYLNGLTLNIGEENGWHRGNRTFGRGLTSEQQIAFANYLRSLTYYNDHITLHNGPATTDAVYSNLIGDNGITGAGTQGFYLNTERSRESTIRWINESAAAGKKWVVTYDEAFHNAVRGPFEEDVFRANVIWSTITAGGAGVEFYFPDRDLIEQNFRNHEIFFEYFDVAHDFFIDNDIPFWEMSSQDAIVNISNGWCLGKEEDTYVIYLETGGTTTLDLAGNYTVKWYNPRTGGALLDGSITNVSSGEGVSIGNAPSDVSEDWVALLEIDNNAVTGVLTHLDAITLALNNTTTIRTMVEPVDAINTDLVWETSNENVATVNANGFVTAVGQGIATLTVTTVDGGHQATVSVTVTVDNNEPGSPNDTPVSFSQNIPNFNGNEDISAGTSLTFGPDGRLYVLEYTGAIKIYNIERDETGAYNVLDVEVLSDIQNIQDYNDDGTLHSSVEREAIGIVVTGTSDNPIIYVSSSDFRIGGGSRGGRGDIGLDTNSGIITRFSKNGEAWNVVDIVRGLPRSEENHATNGLEFTTINGIDFLIVAQGGHTNSGAPSTNFAFTTEYALSAAILSINLSMIEQMPILSDNGRNYIYDLPTLDDPTRENVNGINDPTDPAYDGVDINDPFGGNDGLNQAIVDITGPVQIYSPGYRNAYDLVITESGALYVTDNGANGGWGGFPENEGSPTTVTNNYLVDEPGSSSPSGGEQINNEDHLTKVTNDIQTYLPGSFYGGHPNPVRANPASAGLYVATNPSSIEGALFLTDVHPDGFTGEDILGLPANWPPVPVEVANPVESDWRGPELDNPDGPEDSIITIWGTNTNGIDEYTATNFNGAMKGDLIAGVNTGVLRRVQLDANGNLGRHTPSFASGLGGNALGITCNSDTDPFPGTIWVTTLNGQLVVLEPQDFLDCVAVDDPSFDPLADYDGDGYSNQDELDNGTEICNGASQPNDFDRSAGGILVSDLNDNDDDNDGILDSNDPFQIGDVDTNGSDAFELPVENELFSSNPTLKGYLGLGFTGVMNNGDTEANWLNWLDRRDDPNDPNPNDILGGAIGAMTMQMTSGTALGSTNTQEKAFQYGVITDSESGIVSVHGVLVNFNNPLQLYGVDAPANGELGIFIGDGTQSNYIKFVLTQLGVTVQQEINDIAQAPINVVIAEADRPTSGATLMFSIDTATGSIDLGYTFDENETVTIATITAEGTILEAIQDENIDLAVGLMGTSNIDGLEVEGTWDSLNVFDDNENEIDEIPLVRINAGGSDVASTDNTIDWVASNAVGAQSSPTFSVNTGLNYDDTVTPVRHASIPDYIDNTTYEAIFDQERFDDTPEPEMEYTIPLENGNYVVNIYVSNVFFRTDNIGDRIFDILIEDNLAFDDFDVIDVFGHQVGGMISYTVPVTDGVLNIEFLHNVENPLLNAIEILGASEDVSNPIVVAEIPDQVNALGSQLDASFAIVASGGDGNLVFSANNLPPGITIEPTNGSIGGTLLESAIDGSPYTVDITVDDSDDETSDNVVRSFLWTIVDYGNNTPIVRINSGGAEVDDEGDILAWEANATVGEQIGSFYSVNTGDVFDDVVTLSRHSSIPNYISETTFNSLFDQERFDEDIAPEMQYTIPVTNGTYSVNIYVGNVYEDTSEIGDRLFNIAIEENIVESNIDVVEKFGHRFGGTLTYVTQVTDGLLDITFLHIAGSDNPIVNAIEILSGNVFADTITVTTINNQNNDIGDVVVLEPIEAFGGDESLPFVYQISGQPDGLNIDVNTGVISGTILESAQTGGVNTDGFHNVQVTVSRGDITSDVVNFNWRIGEILWVEKDEPENYTPRHENSFVQAGNKFYLMGGRENAFDIDVYDYTANTWNTIENSPPAEFNHFQAVEYKGLIWVIGAFKTNNFPGEVPTEYIWSFNPATETWIQGPEIPESRRRGSAGLVVYNDKFYVLGGNTDGHRPGYVSWFDEYNPSTGLWTPLSDAPTQRDHFHAAIIDNKLYAAGGRQSNNGNGSTFKPVLFEVDVYDFTTGLWSSVADIPTARAGSSVVNFNDKLIVIGGEVEDELVDKDGDGTFENVDDALPIVESFDPITGQWERLANMNHDRHGTQAIVSGGGIFTLSGSPSRGGGSQTNLEYYGLNNPAGEPSIASTLTTPTTVAFTTDASEDIILAIENGNVGIIINSIEVEGSEDFILTSGVLTKSLLGPNTSHNVSISLDAGATTESAILNINYNNNQIKTVVLTNSDFVNTISLANPGTQFNIEGDQVTLPLTVTSSSNNVSYSAIGLPPVLSIDEATGLISGTILSPIETNLEEGIFIEENGLVIIEAENLNINSNWDIESSNTGFVGTGYLLNNVNRFNSPGNGLITTNISISTPGVYRFQWHNNIGVIDPDDPTTEHNDAWLRFPDADDFYGQRGASIIFPGGSGKTPTPNGASSNGWFKVYANKTNWNWDANTSDNDPHQVFVQFDSPGVYTMEISSRSSGHLIDRVALHHVSEGYSTSQLFAAPKSNVTTGAAGAAENSPYTVTVAVTDNSNTSLSTSETFIWEVVPSSNTSGDDNLALNQPAIQSTTGFGGVASRAVDGDTNGVYNQNSVTHTAPNNATAWWRVDLGAEYNLSEVRIFNRTDNCCTNRLSGVMVYAGIIDSTNPADFTQIGTSLNSDSEQVISDLGVVGRYVLVYSTTGEVISLAEVEVYGTSTTPVAVTSVIINSDNTVLEIGDTAQLTAIVNPVDADNTTVSWSSSDANVATVDANGLVTTLTEGETTITVTTEDGGFTATRLISVNIGNVLVNGVTVTPENIVLEIGATEQLTATVSPVDADNTNVSWSSSNENVATVDINGLVTTLTEGETTITVTTEDGNFTAVSQVIVNNALVSVDSVTVDPEDAILDIGTTTQLTAIISPLNASNTNVTWSSSNETIAIVDNNGLVTALSEGVSTITVTTVDGGFVSTAIINVNEANTSGQGIISFTLINAENDTDLMELTNGAQITISTIENIGLNIRANTNPSIVGSTTFSLTGPVAQVSTENVSPYALFGDNGGNYKEQEFVIGNYTLTAQAYNGAGLSNGTLGGAFTVSFAIIEDEIINEAPVAVASSNITEGDAPLVIEFNGSSSTDDIGIVAYNWDFGNGDSSSIANPSYVYTVAGLYTAILTVTDAEGASDSTSIAITVNEPIPNQAPVAVALSDVTEGDAPLAIEFTGSNSTDDIGVVAYSWDFGNGDSSSIANPSYIYTAAGIYTVILTVTDEEGASDSESITITVNNSTIDQEPIAVALSNVTEGEAPLAIEFDGSNSIDDIGIVTYNWDFGNGDSSSLVNPSYVYTLADSYTVILTVTDVQGSSDSASIEITVNEPIPNQAPVAVALSNITEGDAPLAVEFTGSNSIDDIGVVAYNWDFGNGDSSSLANPSYIYTVAGSYTAVLTVTDEEGASDSESIVITVNEPDTSMQGVVSFTLINGETDTDLMELTNGTQIAIGTIENIGLNIRANTNPAIVGSTTFTLTGPVAIVSTENVSPYALFGDNGGNYKEQEFVVGDYTLTAQAYNGAGLSNGTLGEALTISFSIVTDVNEVSLTTNTSSLDTTKENSLMILPNPASDYIAVVGSDASTDIQIVNFAGQIIKTAKGGQEIYVGDLVVGTYIVQISNGISLQFIKQ